MPRIKAVLLIMLALLVLVLLASVCFGLSGQKRSTQKIGEAPATIIEQPVSDLAPPAQTDQISQKSTTKSTRKISDTLSVDNIFERQLVMTVYSRREILREEWIDIQKKIDAADDEEEKRIYRHKLSEEVHNFIMFADTARTKLRGQYLKIANYSYDSVKLWYRYHYELDCDRISSPEERSDCRDGEYQAQSDALSIDRKYNALYKKLILGDQKNSPE